MAPKRKVEAKATPRSSPLVKPALSPRRTRSSSSSGAPVVPPITSPPTKKLKKTSKVPVKDRVKETDAPEQAAEKVVAEGSSTTVIVEACKQCHQFKKRATMVKEGLEKAVPGINVVINPEKPRRGCLEIRDADGQTFVSLLNMPRPFTRMRELDMDALISDIIEKVK